MSLFILRFGLYFIGIAGVLIGSAFIIFGVNATGQLFNTILAAFYDGGVLTGLDTPEAESELRFYSVFWMAYGVLLIRSANNVSRHIARLPWLIGLFFAGGLARLMAYINSGVPHALFILLMGIELTLPLILWFCLIRVKRS